MFSCSSHILHKYHSVWSVVCGGVRHFCTGFKLPSRAQYSQGLMQHLQSLTTSIRFTKQNLGLRKLPQNLNFIYSITVNPNVWHKITTPVCSINESMSSSLSSVTLKESHPGSELQPCWMNWSARTTSEDTEDYLQQPAWTTRDINGLEFAIMHFLGLPLLCGSPSYTSQ